MIRAFTFFFSVSCIPHNLMTRNELLQGTSLKQGQIPWEGGRGKVARNLFFFFFLGWVVGSFSHAKAI